MATTTTNLSLTKPAAADTTKIREDFNDNMDLIDAQFASTYLAPQAKNAVEITGGTITGITDLVVADGGTGASTFTDGGVLLGSGTGAITAMAVLTDGQMIVGNGTTDPVAESGATLRASIGVAIGTNVQAYDAGLTSIAALTTAANKAIYTTASDTYATYDLTAFARTILDDANAATVRATIGLGPASVVTIGTSGCDYTTVQAALTANATANTIFIVYPGTYANDTITFTANNQSVIGYSDPPKIATITHTQTICDFGAFTNCIVKNIKMVMTVTDEDDVVTGTGSCNFKFCHVECQASGTIANDGPTCYSGTGTIKIVEGSIIYNNTATSTSYVKSAVSVGTGGSITIDDVNITCTGSGASTGHVAVYDKTTGTFDIDKCTITVTDNATNMAAALGTVNGSGEYEFHYNTISVTNNTNIAVGLYADSSGTTLTFRSSFNHYDIVSSGGTAYSFLLADADTVIISQFDDVVAADGVSNTNGTFTQANSATDGDISVSSEIYTDTIAEYTAATGVTIDGVVLKDNSILVAGTTAKGIEITGANTTAQLYIAGTNILANGEQALWINCPSEDGATNGMWISLGSTVTSGDLTGARIKVTTNATTGGDAITGQQTRGIYTQAIAAASDDAGQLIGGQFCTDVSAGSCVVYNAYAIYGHHSCGQSTTIGGDIFVGLLKSQTRETNARSVTGTDGILQIENQAVQGAGATIDVGIHFKDNVTGNGFTYGIDMNSADIATADIRLQKGETIKNTTDGQVDIGGANLNIDSGKKYKINGTNLALSDLGATAWRVFYVNGSGVITELALGASGTFLGSNGASSAPTFSTPAGAGDVVKVGTPADSQVGVWTGDGTIEGDASLTYDRSNLQLTGDIGSTGSRITKGWFTDLQVTNAVAGSITGTARGLVSVSNGDITIQPNGTGDTIIYAPADVVTTKTTTATLTIAEAGTVKVSASSAYTITLPTASGHTGLRYHFIKTDANYNLITLDADGSETFNYENATSAPVLTYARLNTYCAEVTIVSDGTNWQVIDEAMGQVPECRAFLSATQTNLTNNTAHKVDLDGENYDIGSNFDVSTWFSGNCTSTSANKLVDSGASFTGDLVGVRVKNTTDTTYTYITAVDSGTTLSVRDDIFVDTEGYEIKNSKFVCPIPGKYYIEATVRYLGSSVVADKSYFTVIRVNTTNVLSFPDHASYVYAVAKTIVHHYSASINDEIKLLAYELSGVDTVDVEGVAGGAFTYLYIKLYQKD